MGKPAKAPPKITPAPSIKDTPKLEEVPTGKKLPVVELFGPTIQGEGYLIGQRSHFLRLGGCSYRCKWCDSMHAVDPAEVKKNATYMTPKEILDAVGDLPRALWITISGGDPGQHELADLVTILSQEIKVAVETQAAFWRSWMALCQLLIVSPKAPSSGMADKINYDVLVAMKKAWKDVPGMGLIFKVVVFDDIDLEWAIKLHEMFPEVPFYLSVGTDIDNTSLNISIIRNQICDSMVELFNKALKIKSLADVVILPQLHTLAWGTERGR